MRTEGRTRSLGERKGWIVLGKEGRRWRDGVGRDRKEVEDGIPKNGRKDGKRKGCNGEGKEREVGCIQSHAFGTNHPTVSAGPGDEAPSTLTQTLN